MYSTRVEQQQQQQSKNFIHTVLLYQISSCNFRIHNYSRDLHLFVLQYVEFLLIRIFIRWFISLILYDDSSNCLVINLLDGIQRDVKISGRISKRVLTPTLKDPKIPFLRKLFWGNESINQSLVQRNHVSVSKLKQKTSAKSLGTKSKRIKMDEWKSIVPPVPIKSWSFCRLRVFKYGSVICRKNFICRWAYFT